MSGLRDSVIGAFEAALTFLHDLVAMVPALEGASWGWAIILLTVVVRILMTPLAIKQFRSMRAMQKLQPQMKELQKKYKVDRELLRKDPEQYRAKRQKLNEEMMALYQKEGVNPAASCLPLLAQAPVFIALFWTLNGAEDLRGADFYFFTAVGDGGLEQIVRAAGWPGWLLILLMAGTMFWSSRQTMAKNPMQVEGVMAQQQKIIMYVMPVFLAVISLNFPMGVLLYWVTTNIWQVGQQALILREVQHEVETGKLPNGKPEPDEPRRSGGATSGKKGGTDGQEGSSSGKRGDDGERGTPTPPKSKGRAKQQKGKGTPKPSPGKAQGQPGANGKPAKPASGGARAGAPKKREHLPRRRGKGSS